MWSLSQAEDAYLHLLTTALEGDPGLSSSSPLAAGPLVGNSAPFQRENCLRVLVLDSHACSAADKLRESSVFRPPRKSPLLPQTSPPLGGAQKGLAHGVRLAEHCLSCKHSPPRAELRRATPAGFDWMGIASATNPLLPWAELRGATPAGFDWLSIGSAAGLLLPQEMPAGPQAMPREDHDEGGGMGYPEQVGIWRRAWQEERCGAAGGCTVALGRLSARDI